MARNKTPTTYCSEASLPSFFKDHGMALADWQRCLDYAESHLPDYMVEHDIPQGCCSYTVKLRCRAIGPASAGQATSLILQFRPRKYPLSSATSSYAKSWYGQLAPSTTAVGMLDNSTGGRLQVYQMSCLPGQRLDHVQTRQHVDLVRVLPKYRNLINDLAAFYATTWKRGRSEERTHGSLVSCDGKVGSTLTWRLRKLEAQLPSTALRSAAQAALASVRAGTLCRLPIVFTHGDLLPSNILVDPETWHISGIIDWTESEFLPFGINLYVLEHLHGPLSTQSLASRPRYARALKGLERHFWQQLIHKVPELNQPAMREAVELAHTVGLLLWHGIAWDGGKVDRVVDVEHDPEAVARLEVLLDVQARAVREHL